MDLGLKGKIAIITGGTHGIGKAAALSLSREGAMVAIAARTKSDLNKACNDISRRSRDSYAATYVKNSKTFNKNR